MVAQVQRPSLQAITYKIENQSDEREDSVGEDTKGKSPSLQAINYDIEYQDDERYESMSEDKKGEREAKSGEPRERRQRQGQR